LKNPYLDITGARLELTDGGFYRDSSGQLKEYAGGLKVSTISKSGKISCADFLTLLDSLKGPKAGPKANAFLSEIERRAKLEAVPELEVPKEIK
jgi:hypothetical protein